MNRIFTFKKGTKFSNWEEIIANGETITVEEFNTYKEALEAYDKKYNDPDIYGVE